MDIVELLASDNFFVINRDLIKIFGLHEAIIIGELASEYRYWKRENKLTDDGLFFSTRENIEENTGLSEYQQREAINNLIKCNILSVVKKGLPAKNYYKFNQSTVLEFLNNKSLKNSSTRPLEIKQQDTEKLKPKNNKEKIINKNNKSIKTGKNEKLLKFLEGKSIEYDISEKVLDKLEEFFKSLIDNKILVTEQKIEATLSLLAKVSEDKQLKAIQLSLDKGWKSIDPSWLDNISNSPKGEHLNLTHHDTETPDEHNERVAKLKSDPNTYKF